MRPSGLALYSCQENHVASVGEKKRSRVVVVRQHHTLSHVVKIRTPPFNDQRPRFQQQGLSVTASNTVLSIIESKVPGTAD